MRGRSETLEIGPWVGGLNVRSDPYNLGDDELSQCQNAYLDIDGSLSARPIYAEADNHPEGLTSAYVIGNFRFNNFEYLVVATNLGLYIVRASGASEVWTFIRANQQGTEPWPGSYFTTAVYRNVLYVSGTIGLDRLRIDISNPLSGFPVTVDNSIPPSSKLFAFKGRLFARSLVFNEGSRLIYSNVITDVATWEKSGSVWSDFLDINPRNGDAIVDLTLYNDDLLILKQNSIYVLVYDDLIANAFVRQISDSIGGTTDRLNGISRTQATVTYQNTVYILSQNQLYELSGYNFIELNIKLPFRNAGSISLFEDHIFVSTGNTETFVYNLLTKTWSRWVSNWRPHTWTTVATENGNLIAYVTNPFTYGDTPARLLRATFSNDEAYAHWEENFAINFRTKIFSFNDTAHYKKLKYWLLTLSSAASLGEDWPSTPVVQLKANMYDATFPAVDGGYIQTDTFTPVAIVRTVAKVLKTLRFKFIAFEIEQEGVFQNWNRPRFFGITALVSQKQTVDRKGN